MMYSRRWIAGENPEEAKKIEELLGVNNFILDKLAKICYNIVKSSEIGDSDYDSPNWQFRVADRIGYRRAYKEIMTLCTRMDDQSKK